MEKTIIRYKRKVRIVLYALLSIVLLGAILSIFFIGSSLDLIYPLSLVILVIAGILQIIKFRIELHDDRITRRNIFNEVSIEYMQIYHLEFYHNSLLLRAKKKNIKITNDIEKNEFAIRYVVSKAKDNLIEVEGNEDMLIKYWNQNK